MTTRIGIAGAGRVARALGRALGAGAIASRNAEHAAEAASFVGAEAVPLAELPRRCGRILIAVSDDAVNVATPPTSVCDADVLRGARPERKSKDGAVGEVVS